MFKFAIVLLAWGLVVSQATEKSSGFLSTKSLPDESDEDIVLMGPLTPYVSTDVILGKSQDRHSQIGTSMVLPHQARTLQTTDSTDSSSTDSSSTDSSDDSSTDDNSTETAENTTTTVASNEPKTLVVLSGSMTLTVDEADADAFTSTNKTAAEAAIAEGIATTLKLDPSAIEVTITVTDTKPSNRRLADKYVVVDYTITLNEEDSADSSKVDALVEDLEGDVKAELETALIEATGVDMKIELLTVTQMTATQTTITTTTVTSTDGGLVNGSW
eukprot:CAMPEP_0206448542 /NCGR_PEP_ID=MMETSP0324_2-20121206/17532_1 /ASSEMBLY_ACC=CAM_ASM_000836 /TAXON_ID=2866 /ORGANISM="Crypthecodinium cohnii, Strain Seligo" /LENGTH=272 /DNA_ID=CAMNT_0053917701 /DNA_START=132 /DNA_END=947 /DNA_ORIENTATION=-